MFSWITGRAITNEIKLQMKQRVSKVLILILKPWFNLLCSSLNKLLPWFNKILIPFVILNYLNSSLFTTLIWWNIGSMYSVLFFHTFIHSMKPWFDETILLLFRNRKKIRTSKSLANKTTTNLSNVLQSCVQPVPLFIGFDRIFLGQNWCFFTRR